jgi:TetR/AcrR family transcriptional regulator
MENDQVLLNCALTLFSQRGYDAVSVQAVVEAAGVTKPTLYHYFSSKRGLLDALIKRETGLLLGRVFQAVDYHGDLVLTLERIVLAYFKFAQEHGSFYRMQLASYFSPPECESNQAMRPFIEEQKTILENLFIQAGQSHGNLRGKHRRLAVSLLGEINALIGLHLNGELMLSDELIYQTVHQFMYGIFS